MRRLQPCEHIGVEFERLERLWHRLGPEQGERALGAAMEDLAVLLHDTVVAWRQSDFPTVRLRALGVQGMADRLGLTLLDRIAGDVIALCGDGDDAALAATVARMGRVGERSLLAIWDAQVPVG